MVVPKRVDEAPLTNSCDWLFTLTASLHFPRIAWQQETRVSQ